MDQRTKITKTMLATALIDMVKEQDINRISIRELCQRADVNRSTFYKYYGSQYDLLRDIEDWFVDKIKCRLQETIDTRDDSSIIRSVLFVLDENIKLARFFYFTRPDFNFFAKMVDDLELRGYFINEIEGIPDDMKEYVHSFYKIGVHRIICAWLNSENRSNINEIADLIAELRKRVCKSL